MLIRVLLAADRAALGRRLKGVLSRPGVLIESVQGRKALWRCLSGEPCDLFVVSHSMLSGEGSELIPLIRALPDRPEVVIITNDEDEENRTRLLAEGCLAVLYETLSNDMLAEALTAVVERRQSTLSKPLSVEREDVLAPRLDNFICLSPSMQRFMRLVRRVVHSDTTLLITGETGVGKEWLARAVHTESPRSRGPFVAVNCGALAESLLESELFGHVEGAFTGASRGRRGVFEAAHGGTIFLDEIGEMPLHLQVKLLRVLQSREVQRVGAEKPIMIDVRVMAASNRDLESDVEQGEFRRDLYYRLGVVNLELPPLRDRREDIPDLVDSYINHFKRQFPQGIREISPAALDALVAHDWPGNVRELVNVIERAMLLSETSTLELDDFPNTITGRPEPARMAPFLPSDDSGWDIPEEWLEQPLRMIRERLVNNLERAYLARLLTETGGRVGQTAERAGLDPRSLYNKMQRLGLDKREFRR